MKKVIYILLISYPVLFFTSCESCTRQASKKITQIGISALEGVSEAISEHGEEASEKAMDALGVVAKGAGRSLDRQLDEHAEHVFSVTGRTLVQSVEGLDKGIVGEYYDEILYEEQFTNGINLDFFGKIKSKAVVDAYFIILETGKYKCKFDFLDTSGNSLLTKEAVIEKENEDRLYSVVSFAFDQKEENALSKTEKVKIVVAKQ